MSELEAQIVGYLEELRRTAASEHTVRAYESDLRQFLEYFSPPGEEPPALAEFDVLKIREWLAGLYDRKLDRISMRRKLAALRSFFRHVVRQGIMKTNPARLVLTPKTGQKLPAVMTAEQANALVDAPPSEQVQAAWPARDRAMLEFLYGCGLRASELVGMNLDDIDFAERWVRVRGKGRKERQVPFGRKAAAALERYLGERAAETETREQAAATQTREPVAAAQTREPVAAEQVSKQAATKQTREPVATAQTREPLAAEQVREQAAAEQTHEPVATAQTREPLAAEQVREQAATKQTREPVATAQTREPLAAEQVREQATAKQTHEQAVFLNRRGRRITTRGVQGIVKLYALLVAGDSSIHPHSFRHAYATHLLSDGADLRAVQELLGHARLSTTQKYTQLSLTDLMAVYDRAHPKA